DLLLNSNPLYYFINDRIGITAALGYIGCQLAQLRISYTLVERSLQQSLTQQFDYPMLGRIDAASVRLRTLITDKLLVIRDCCCEGFSSAILGCYGLYYWWCPAIGAFGDREKRLKFPLGPQDSLAIGLIYCKNVADFHYPRLHRLYLITHPRHKHDDGNISGPHNIYFILADSDCFNDHSIITTGIQDRYRINRCAR